MKISATIITLNEEKHLGQCLESLRTVVDEVLIVDSGSLDETLTIAKRSGARAVVRPWAGYSDQKNFAASLALNDWILSVDADECLSPALRESILAVKESSPSVAAFEVPRKAFYLGRWIKHSGWYPDYKKRLYLRTRATWEGNFVHEALRVDGPVSRLQGDLLHYTCETLSEHLRSLDRYTTLAAEELWSRGRRANLFEAVASASGSFVKSYLLKQGFRDGAQGLLIAGFASYYNFAKHAKLWELQQKQGAPHSSAASSHDGRRK